MLLVRYDHFMFVLDPWLSMGWSLHWTGKSAGIMAPLVLLLIRW